MKVLVGCEKFCRVRDAFLLLGHDAWSCDLEEDVLGDGPDAHGGPHWTGDVREILDGKACGGGEPWDLALFFPPCTYLTSSGLHWNKRIPGRAKKTELALAFVDELMHAPIEKVVVENPRGRIGTAIRPSDQTIQPYMFGDDASKETCLWLKNLPPLDIPEMSKWVAPRMVRGADGKYRPRWSNQTDSGQNRLGPSPTRADERGKTYPGIANAMAMKWGGWTVNGLDRMCRVAWSQYLSDGTHASSKRYAGFAFELEGLKAKLP